MKVACIVPSAGKGKRLRSRENKPFVLLDNKPLLYHTLNALNKSSFIDYIVVVVSRGKLKACKNLVKKFKLNKICFIVEGGKKRFNSVKNGLTKIKSD